MSLSDLALRLLACSRCNAQPGHRCTTRSGRRATYSHAARTEALYEAWRDGYGEGLSHAASYARSLVERGKTAAEVLTLLERSAR